jgi:hypothetical protein
MTALADVSVWRSLKRLDMPRTEFRRTMTGLLDCAAAVAAQDQESPAQR